VLSSKRQDWFVRSQYNVSSWCALSTCRLLFHWGNTTQIQISTGGLVKKRHEHHLAKGYLFLSYNRKRITQLVLNINHSLTACLLTVTRRVSLVEQELLTFSRASEFTSGFYVVNVVQYFVFYVVYCRSLFVLFGGHCSVCPS
jgi:hypothetical protein